MKECGGLGWGLEFAGLGFLATAVLLINNKKNS